MGDLPEHLGLVEVALIAFSALVGWISLFVTNQIGKLRLEMSRAMSDLRSEIIDRIAVVERGKGSA